MKLVLWSALAWLVLSAPHAGASTECYPQVGVCHTTDADSGDHCFSTSTSDICSSFTEDRSVWTAETLAGTATFVDDNSSYSSDVTDHDPCSEGTRSDHAFREERTLFLDTLAGTGDATVYGTDGSSTSAHDHACTSSSDAERVQTHSTGATAGGSTAVGGASVQADLSRVDRDASTTSPSGTLTEHRCDRTLFVGAFVDTPAGAVFLPVAPTVSC